MTAWYEFSTGNHQGGVAEEETGRTVAVCYDKADAPIVAAAPDLLAALQALVAADNCNYDAHTMRYEGYFAAARDAIHLACTGDLVTSPRPDHAAPHREIQRTLVASMAHITKEDSIALESAGLEFVCFEKSDYGWWINIPDEAEELAERLRPSRTRRILAEPAQPAAHGRQRRGPVAHARLRRADLSRHVNTRLVKENQTMPTDKKPTQQFQAGPFTLTIDPNNLSMVFTVNGKPTEILLEPYGSGLSFGFKRDDDLSPYIGALDLYYEANNHLAPSDYRKGLPAIHISDAGSDGVVMARVHPHAILVEMDTGNQPVGWIGKTAIFGSPYANEAVDAIREHGPVVAKEALAAKRREDL